jgi:hypothetical protein
MHPFILASKKKLRFAGPRGNFSTEDLFDLDLRVLDRMAVELDTSLKAGRTSFLSSPSRATPGRADDELRLSILTAVIKLREEETAASKERALRRAERERLQALLSKKREEAELSLSEEEILARLEAVDE